MPFAPAVAPTGFDQVLHLRYRLFLPSLLSLSTLAVYDALRSCVWRQENFGPDTLTLKAVNGVLAAQPTQGQLAEVTGLTRETVNRSLRRLEELGWLVADAEGLTGTAKVYDLGIKHLDSAGGTEVFYADAMMVKLYEDVDRQAQTRHGTSYRRLAQGRQKPLVASVLNLRPRKPSLQRQTSMRTGATVMVPATFHLAAALAALKGAQANYSQHVLFAQADLETVGDEGVGTRNNFGPIREKLPGTGVRENREGVSVDHTPYELASHPTTPIFERNALVLQQIDKKDFAAIDKYIESPSLRSGEVFVLCTQTSPFTPLGEPCGMEAHSGGAYPLASPLTPVPPPPSPVTGVRDCVTAPVDTYDEAVAMPVQPPKPPWTSLDPDDPRRAPVGGASGGEKATRISEMERLVEEAKARSREALTAKVEKLRAKERARTNLSSDKSYRAQKSAALRIEQTWKAEMSTAFPGVPQIAWFKQERGKLTARKEGKLAADLLDGYGGDEAVVVGLVETFVRCWAELGPMLTKQDDSVPTFGLLYACHATVAAEMPRLKKKFDVVARYEAWKSANAGNDFAVPPPELEAAYKAATAKKGKR